MNRKASLLALLSFAMWFTSAPLLMAQSTPLAETGWGELPPIPDPIGVAGAFAGVSNGSLLVAGGANFDGGKRPWNGGVKTWRDAIYVLRDADSQWTTCRTTLPRPLGYGVGVTTPEGVWCIGGSDRERHYSDVFVMQFDGADVRIIPQPALPVPLANSCGALVGSRIVVAGGIESPNATQATTHLFVLDTALPPEDRKWTPHPGWPAAPRMLAAAGAHGDNFYLFGGVELRADARGLPERIKPFLSDAWRLRFDAAGAASWTRLANLPAPRVASPSPAPLIGDKLLLFSGDDGSLSAAEEDRHPGFPSTVFSYAVADDRWKAETPILRWDGRDPATKPEECVWPPVTTGTAVWQQLIVIPSGEIRPGVRTRRVLTAGVEILE